MLKLSGNIIIVNENNSGAVMVEIAACEVEKALAFLDALECGRIKAFSIEDKDQIITLRKESATAYITVESGDHVSFLLSESQFGLLRCCCIDRILKYYSDPYVDHVDLDCGRYDFTFSIAVPEVR